MRDAKEYAKIMIKKKLNNRYTDTKNGNLTINKMLYFAQLISLAKYDEVLFKNDIFAFENGSVVEDVRQEYKNNYQAMIEEAKSINIDELDEKEEDVIDETIRLFSGFSPEELSQITHSHTTWINSFEDSKDGNFYDMNKQKMSVKSMQENEAEWIKNFFNIEKKKENYVSNHLMDNKTIFYYDPNSYSESEIKKIISEFDGSEEAYTVVKEDGKAVIY